MTKNIGLLCLQLKSEYQALVSFGACVWVDKCKTQALPYFSSVVGEKHEMR